MSQMQVALLEQGEDAMKVTLVSYTKNPEAVCDLAAKTCVSKHMPSLDEHSDLKSLKLAMKSGHYSVLEHASFTFSIEGISRVTSHQLVRHRMASYEQQSERYVSFKDGFEYSMPESVINVVRKDSQMTYYLNDLEYVTAELAKSLKAADVPDEDIRFLYPQGILTNIVVTMNGRELLHFLALRRCTRAQWEIRAMADKMAEEVQKVAPVMFEKCGPTCEQTGRCPELKSCGRCKNCVPDA